MKKNFLFAVVLAFFLCSAAWAEKVQSVTINGETLTKAVATITFDGDNVVLHFADQSTQTADMNDVSISFMAGTATSITNLNAFSFNGLVGDVLRVGNAQRGTSLVVYNAAGQQVAKAQATEGETHISLAGLSAGTYILHAGQQAVKFVKK